MRLLGSAQKGNPNSQNDELAIPPVTADDVIPSISSISPMCFANWLGPILGCVGIGATSIKSAPSPFLILIADEDRSQVLFYNDSVTCSIVRHAWRISMPIPSLAWDNPSGGFGCIAPTK